MKRKDELSISTKVVIWVIVPLIMCLMAWFAIRPAILNAYEKAGEEVGVDLSREHVLETYCGEPFEKEFWNDSYVSPEQRQEVLDYYYKNEKTNRDLACLMMNWIVS